MSRGPVRRRPKTSGDRPTNVLRTALAMWDPGRNKTMCVGLSAATYDGRTTPSERRDGWLCVGNAGSVAERRSHRRAAITLTGGRPVGTNRDNATTD